LIGADVRGANLRGADLGEAFLYRARLCGANLSGADLRKANFSEAYLRGANLTAAKLGDATLQGADLMGAELWKADLSFAGLSEANLLGSSLVEAVLTGADCSWANLSKANLSKANLTKAILHGTVLVQTDLRDAVLSRCDVHGISAWNVNLNRTKQQDLIITGPRQPEITTDDIEVAQFIYLMLHNEKLQRVIDTITSKVVLILGRFSPERKVVLDALRDDLRKRNYVPVVFDFEKPRSGTTFNTVTLLARMARFVIADVSDAKSVLMELQQIVQSSPRLPVQPIIVAGQKEPGMFDSFSDYPWFLKVHTYETPAQLLVDLQDRVIGPAEIEVAKRRG
jgi:uncharacterized protein YjbI with pentapeptide repeats